MSDDIKLDPRSAGETLSQVQSNLKSYLSEITDLGAELQAVCTTTNSAPLAQVFQELSKALNEIARAVNAGIGAYSSAFQTVIEQWINSDATAAGRVSFDKPHFDEIKLTEPDFLEVLVNIPKLINFLEKHTAYDNKMDNLFTVIDNEIKASIQYWTGDGADHSRNTWDKKVVPISEKVKELMKKARELLEEEKNNVKKRDVSYRID